MSNFSGRSPGIFVINPTKWPLRPANRDNDDANSHKTNRNMEQPQLGPAPNLHGAGMSQLTRREREVLGLLAEGNSYKMVAVRMGIANSTVPSFIKSIYAKLRVHSAAGAIGKVFLGRG